MAGKPNYTKRARIKQDIRERCTLGEEITFKTGMTLDDVQRQFIKFTYERLGNKVWAAEILGISKRKVMYVTNDSPHYW